MRFRPQPFTRMSPANMRLRSRGAWAMHGVRCTMSRQPPGRIWSIRLLRRKERPDSLRQRILSENDPFIRLRNAAAGCLASCRCGWLQYSASLQWEQFFFSYRRRYVLPEESSSFTEKAAVRVSGECMGLSLKLPGFRGWKFKKLWAKTRRSSWRENIPN